MSAHRPAGPAYVPPPGHQTFLLPDLGEGLTEAEIVTWLVEDGDVIVVDQIVVEVETAKAKVEVPAPYAGTVAIRHAAEGDTLEVGAPLMTVSDGSAVASDAPADAPAEAPAQALAEVDLEAEVAADPAVDSAAATIAGEPVDTGETGGGSGNVLIGYGTTDTSSTRRRRHTTERATEVAAIVAPPVVVRTPAVGRHETAAETPNTTALRVTSPIVRRLARDAGIDLTQVAGSGPDGLITRADVLAAISDATAGAGMPPRPAARPSAGRPAAVPAGVAPAATPAKAPAAASAGVMAGDRHTGLGVLERRAMSAFRRTVAASLSRSRAEIPEATVWVDVDFTQLVALRASLAGQPDSPGLMAYLARFITAGLASHPELNSTYDAERDELVMWDGVNLGIAVQSPRGLVAPAILDAHTMTTRQLGAALKKLTVDARDGKSTPHELLAGTFTLNNYGMYNVDGSAAIINHPQTAIMGFGRVIDRPWVIDGQIVVRKIGQMSFVFDHRVCDGGLASSFIRFVADAIENPGSVLADL